MREEQRFPKGWLKPGEMWPGQSDGLPEPGTKESEEYHRKVYREEFGREHPPHLERRKPKEESGVLVQFTRRHRI